jgi:hypothetical protein
MRAAGTAAPLVDVVELVAVVITSDVKLEELVGVVMVLVIEDVPLVAIVVEVVWLR